MTRGDNLQKIAVRFMNQSALGKCAAAQHAADGDQTTMFIVNIVVVVVGRHSVYTTHTRAILERK